MDLAFINYFDNLNNSLKFPILLNRTTYEQNLLISLEAFDFEPELLKAPTILKDFIKPSLELHSFHTLSL